MALAHPLSHGMVLGIGDLRSPGLWTNYKSIDSKSSNDSYAFIGLVYVHLGPNYRIAPYLMVTNTMVSCKCSFLNQSNLWIMMIYLVVNLPSWVWVQIKRCTVGYKRQYDILGYIPMFDGIFKLCLKMWRLPPVQKFQVLRGKVMMN